MRLAANLSLLYTELPWAQRPAAAAADGFEGAEILFPYGETDRTALAQALRDAGLPVALINTPTGPAQEPGFAAVPGEEARFRDALERGLEAAHELSSPALHVMAGRPPAEAAAALETLEANLRWALPRARAAGVRLTLEALNRHDMPGYAYQQPQQALAVVRRIDDPALRLQFDLYHAAREGLDAAAEFRSCRPWVGHVQLAEAQGRRAPDLSNPVTRRGVTGLVEAGWDGWLGLEYRPAGPTRDSLDWRGPLRELIGGRPA